MGIDIRGSATGHSAQRPAAGGGAAGGADDEAAAAVTAGRDPAGAPLSWAADGRTLAFQQWTGQHGAIRLLDTAAPGGNLRAAAQRGVMFRGPDSNVGNTLLTPDGTKIVTAVYPPGKGNQVKINFTEFSVRTGKAIRVRDAWQFVLGPGPDPWNQELWTNSSGRTLIVISPPGMDPAGHYVRHSIQPVIGVLQGNRFTPIPGSPRFAEHSIRRLVVPPDTAAAGTAGIPTAVPAVMSAAMPAEATSLALRRL
jgi:hypothetical protein